MAIDSHSNSHWATDSHRFSLTMLGTSLATLKSEDKIRATILDDDTSACRESLASRTSICSHTSAELNPLPAVPAFLDCWTERVSSSLASWNSWERPLPVSHQFWSSPAAESLEDALLMQKWRQHDNGNAPYLLSLFATAPRDGSACLAIADQMQCFNLWDTWMKKVGRPDEFDQLGSFVTSLSLSRKQTDSSTALPKRLARKFPLKAEAFATSFAALFSDSHSLGWESRYASFWKLYAVEGLKLHRKIDNMSKAKQTADPSGFLVYRALTSGFPQLALLAARNNMIGSPDPLALDIVSPLLSLGSMLMATYSDLFLASKQLEHKGASVSALEVFDDEWTVSMHNSLLVLFHAEADSLLAQATPKSSRYNEPLRAVNSQVVAFVTTIKAVLQGVVLWYNMAPSFNDPNGAVSSPKALESAPIVFAPSQDAFRHADAQCSDIAPSWAKEIVDNSVDQFLALLRKP